MKAFIFLALIALVCGDGDPSSDNVDCDKEFEDCPTPSGCEDLYVNPNAKLQCLTQHELRAACKCLCDLIGICGKDPPEQTTTAAATTAATTQAATTAAPTTAAAEPTKAGCFSGDVQVMTNLGQMSVSELSRNRDAQIQVLDESGQIRLGNIWMWIHLDHNQEANYLQVTAGGSTMELTDDHLAYTVPCEGGDRTSKFAGKLRVGECTLVQRGSEAVPAKITDIQTVRKTGVYSFVTETGTAVVNGVVASSYNTFEFERVQHLFFTAIHAIMELLPTSLFGTGASHLEYPIYFFDSADTFSPTH